MLAKRRAPVRPSPPFESCTIHRIHCTKVNDHQSHPSVTYFEDAPQLFAGDCKASALRGKRHIADISDFVESNSHIGLILYRDYDCEAYHKIIEPRFRPLEKPDDPVIKWMLRYFYRLDDDGMPARSHGEAMLIPSEELRGTFHRLTNMSPDIISELEDPVYMRELITQMYHHRGIREDPVLAEKLGEESFETAVFLVEFMEKMFGQEYNEADALFSKGLVTKFHLPKLFAAQDVLVTREQGQPCAYVLEAFPERPTELSCWTWRFDGRFWKYRTALGVEWPDLLDMIAITDLSVYPLKYATIDVQRLLASRGRQFMGGMQIQPRYMVDMATYRELHPEEHAPEEPEYLNNETMRAEEPPDDQFLLLLPITVHGFGFQDKKWRLLFVSHISIIKWNEQSFDHLVLHSTKKELIQALVKKHDSTNESTDVIEGKGNGLILLLHGGPGTGKTLTAESVAELTHRPLYRVTCGDVGTNADEVEEYLESVLHLGKVWRCVVLLDEADVFLEERTSQDLQRNALVSVFLRVIEYYEGVLVLTSNRIGTFDEAFKSRVQLIVHYPKLQKEERRRIWFKFIKNLRITNVGAHIEELEERIEDLSDNELNGREIRNTIQTATLLAQFKDEHLRYEHLMKVMAVSKEFKQYLHDRFGHEDEDLVQQRQIR
ncbi:ATPase, AAA-type, core [Penicillium expansum]|nr:ATPase, AAA-type, core [Penicillium expansum]